MPGKTHGDKIDELAKLAATLDERLNNARTGLEQLAGGQDKLVEKVDAVRQEVAVIRERLNELKSNVQEAAKRRFGFWSLTVATILGSVFGSAITLLGQALLKYVKG